MYRAHNITRNTLVADKLDHVTSLWDRMKGLLGRDALYPQHGLWIDPCNSIHTFFMRFPIDVVFVSREGKVVKTFENFSPFRISPWIRKARSVLELPIGELERSNTQIGDYLTFETHR